MRMKGDLTVNAAIDNFITRESDWTHKKSTVIASEAVYKYAVSQNYSQVQVPLMSDNIGSKERAKKIHAMKASVKKTVFSDSHEIQKLHLDTLL